MPAPRKVQIAAALRFPPQAEDAKRREQDLAMLIQQQQNKIEQKCGEEGSESYETQSSCSADEMHSDALRGKDPRRVISTAATIPPVPKKELMAEPTTKWNHMPPSELTNGMERPDNVMIPVIMPRPCYDWVQRAIERREQRIIEMTAVATVTATGVRRELKRTELGSIRGVDTRRYKVTVVTPENSHADTTEASRKEQVKKEKTTKEERKLERKERRRKRRCESNAETDEQRHLEEQLDEDVRRREQDNAMIMEQQIEQQGKIDELHQQLEQMAKEPQNRIGRQLQEQLDEDMRRREQDHAMIMEQQIKIDELQRQLEQIAKEAQDRVGRQQEEREKPTMHEAVREMRKEQAVKDAEQTSRRSSGSGSHKKGATIPKEEGAAKDEAKRRDTTELSRPRAQQRGRSQQRGKHRRSSPAARLRSVAAKRSKSRSPRRPPTRPPWEKPKKKTEERWKTRKKEKRAKR